MMGLRLLQASDGQNLSVAAAIGRYFLWLLCVSTIVIGVLAAIPALLSPTRKSLLDHASGSVVVRRI
jgi:hypothetical protein